MRTLAEIESAGLKMGQLTREEQRLVIKAACDKLQRELSQPHVQAALKKVLDDVK